MKPQWIAVLVLAACVLLVLAVRSGGSEGYVSQTARYRVDMYNEGSNGKPAGKPIKSFYFTLSDPKRAETYFYNAAYQLPIKTLTPTTLSKIPVETRAFLEAIATFLRANKLWRYNNYTMKWLNFRTLDHMKFSAVRVG